MSKIIHVTVRHGRFTNELFTSTQFDYEVDFLQIVSALEEKKFKVEVNRYESLGKVSLVVIGLRSDKAVAYAQSIVMRIGRKVGFGFLSTEHV